MLNFNASLIILYVTHKKLNFNQNMKNTIIVLGMHRSGTSAMAGVLNKLGCYSGEKDDLYSADSNNSTGYYERKDIVSCNEDILSNHFINEFQNTITTSCFENSKTLDNYGWMFGAWSPHIQNRTLQDTPKSIYNTLKKLRHTANENAIAYAIKDPRISITYPYWKNAFNELPIIIIMLRHPMHVAESLLKRDGIPIEVGLDIWASYTKSAFDNTKDNSRIIIKYDDLVDNTEFIINGTCKFLQANGIGAKVAPDAIELIKNEMRHSNANNSPAIESDIIKVYERLIDNDLEALSLLKNPQDLDYSGWEKVLFVPSLSHKKKMKETISTMNAKVTRLLKHPITGPIIKMVRWFKKDETFGNDSIDEKINYYDQLRPEMLRLVPTDAKKILDVGCAHGVFSENIKNRQSAEVWGVEINKEASEEASKRLNRVINKDLESALEDLPDNSFDCIVFNDVLEHMVDPYSALNKIKSKLTPNGVVVASLPNVRFFEVLFFLLFFKRWDYQECGVLDRTHLRFFTYKNIKELFESNGYDICEFKGINPTKSILYNVVNILTLGFMWDSRYIQFACVAQKKKKKDE
jgi:2-polyprenyl-3-methyl-5-hydroxy-6-metoxy-1,4-benzoquinol methylase